MHRLRGHAADRERDARQAVVGRVRRGLPGHAEDVHRRQGAQERVQIVAQSVEVALQRGHGADDPAPPRALLARDQVREVVGQRAHAAGQPGGDWGF